MNYLIDTDIAIEYLRGNQKAISKLMEFSFEKLFISTLSLAELFYGVYRSNNQEKHTNGLLLFLEKVELVSINFEICKLFGKTKSELKKQGNTVDNFDLLIGCISLHGNYTLLTNNIGHYNKIQGLKIMGIE